MTKRPDGLGHEKKLSDQDVEQIRKLYDETCSECGKKKWTMKMIAEKFEVSSPLIHSVIHRNRYFAEK